MTAKMVYVLCPMLLKATGVIMTTMKLKIQLAEVDNAFVGARILRGTWGSSSANDSRGQDEQTYRFQQGTTRSCRASQ